MKPSLPVLLVFVLCLFAVGYASAATEASVSSPHLVEGSTLTVTKVEDTNDGVCDADCSLREAVAAAASGDTVVFSTLFNTPQTITLTLGQITINKNLTITGTGQNLTTISGNNASRIFFTNGNGFTVNISGMTFRDGNGGSATTGVGGAIRFGGSSTLNIFNATFMNNRAGSQPGSGAGVILGSGNCILNLSNLIVTGNFSLGTAISSNGSMDIRDSVVTHNEGGSVVARTLHVERCVFSDNTGEFSYGVGANHLTMSDSTITNNTGGGVTDGDAASTMTIERCLISGNSRNPGGAGVKSSGMTLIKDSQIINNRGVSSGGGISSINPMNLINSNISGNTTSFAGSNDGGAGIVNAAGTLYVINSTVSGNAVTSGTPGVGGGIYSSNFFEVPGRVYLVNSTIANNTSPGPGGGVRIDPPNGEGRFSNTIVSGNNSTGTAEEDVSGVIISNGINLIGNTFGSSGWIAGDLLNVNPLLGPLTDNGGSTMIHALLPGSPAINAGNNAVAIDPQTQLPLTTDQRGFLRFFGGTVDIGAYEVQPEITGTITYGNATGSPTPRFVSGVLLTALGSPNLTATSGVDGTYTLGGFGSGAYTVTPSKTGGANGISSFDAGLIARHVAGITPLTGNQLIVADVSGNGTLSSFDSGQIARYTVGISGFGSSANWIFLPVNRTYSSINGDISGEDFIALLMGDVSGNWTDTTGNNQAIPATPSPTMWSSLSLPNLKSSSARGSTASEKLWEDARQRRAFPLGNVIKPKINVWPLSEKQSFSAIRAAQPLPYFGASPAKLTYDTQECEGSVGQKVITTKAMCTAFAKAREDAKRKKPIPIRQPKPLKLDVECTALDRGEDNSFHPTIWAATPGTRDDKSVGGLFKSTDGGQTWDRIDHSYRNKWLVDIFAITRFQDKKILLAGVGHGQGFSLDHGIMRSDDGGLTWIRVYSGLRIMSIDVDTENPQNVTARIFGPESGFGDFGVIRDIVSTNAGASWKTVTENKYDETQNLTPQRQCSGKWQLHPSKDGLKLLGKTA